MCARQIPAALCRASPTAFGANEAPLCRSQDRFSQNLPRTPVPSAARAWVTWFLVGSTVAVWFWQLLGSRRGDDVVGNEARVQSPGHGRAPLLDAAHLCLGPCASDVRASRLFWLHLATNMFPLFCLGPALERWRGPWRFLGLYLGGAVTSALVWYACGGNRTGSSAPAARFLPSSRRRACWALHAAESRFLFFTLSLRMSMRVAGAGALRGGSGADRSCTNFRTSPSRRTSAARLSARSSCWWRRQIPARQYVAV